MINAIFNENGRMTGYTTVVYSTSNDSKTVKEVSESELNKLIPDSFDADNWKEVRRHYKLSEDGEVVFDEGYEPDEEGV